MRLKLSHSRKTGGMNSKKVIFILNAKAGYSNEEQANIGKYDGGSHIIYNSESARRHLTERAMHKLIPNEVPHFPIQNAPTVNG